jgi:hypothetical protein
VDDRGRNAAAQRAHRKRILKGYLIDKLCSREMTAIRVFASAGVSVRATSRMTILHQPGSDGEEEMISGMVRALRKEDGRRLREPRRRIQLQLAEGYG